MLMQKRIIYGIDIARGSPRARELPRYALAILKDGEVSHQSMLRRQKIFNMIQKERPEIIAVDNIFELAADRSELLSLMERLPEGVKLVQVTGGLHPEPLVRLARKHGFSFDPENPNDEAEACARLADMGVGHEVSLFEDITKIKVSRARSLGRGGWSQNRYCRKVHGAVLQRSREIENALRDLSREKGIRFEAVNVKGFGGYVRSEFTVYAKRGEIPIHPMASNDAQVSVRSVERDKIRYISLKPKNLRRKFTIVGIDPGTTVGIAILSLDGDLLYLKSFRGIAPDEVVKLIAEYGKPAVIASDVTPMPGSVEKIRRSFNAVPASPGIEVSAEEKIALGRTFGYSNDHERDALTAALLTYRSYKNIFTRIEKKAPQNADVELIKFHVICGASIEAAIEKVRAAGEPEKQRPGERAEKPEERAVDESLLKLRETVQRQSEQIQNLQEYLEELKKELIAKDRKISKLESRLNSFKKEAYSEIRKSKEIRIRDETIESLKKEVSHKNKTVKELRRRSNKLRKIQKMEVRGEGTAVKVIAAFTKESIAETKEKYGLKTGDVVFLENPSGGGAATAQILIEAGIRAVLIPEDISHAAEETFFKGDMPVLKDIPLERAEDFAMAEPETLKTAIAAWEKEADAKRHKAKEDELQSLFEEYKSERRRGLV
jgi:predicted RNase H-like nuclease (RuvC/YqgF family)